MDCVVNGPIPTDFMTNTEDRLAAYRFNSDTLELSVLDQLLLPHESVFIQVRGAPLTAVVGALGLLIEMNQVDFASADEFVRFVEEKVAYLIESRPTAINLRNALEHIIEVAKEEGDADVRKHRVAEAILKLLNDETEENRRLIWNGYQEILSLKPPRSKFVLMTICNTGALATSSWGTALGVIYALHQADLVEMVYALETRPYNQGVRLTATELRSAKVPFKLITDSMAAWTMKTHKIDAILVGADQVALNGDTANKIGTYMLAVLAKHHSVPFYAVVPVTSVNLSRQTGDDITIEERPAAEMLSINGVFIGAEDTPVWNPAFDVTPGALITKIITDCGNFAPEDLKNANLKQI
ncbi:S-methyl-5-thioribose-1-phosphate isomerase [Teladorsagia circumcincta]|uniref:S-methyl-5-thioribose-1-phosphate isomerase n=1 Tax=Teladorsagia circumcincta TaxID=45464 RepID=A0A2G9V546_TELCI|nr:S-methyl-5-thioribose-1-phosphate isomerase [Teladorsagia circumcincta]